MIILHLCTKNLGWYDLQFLRYRVWQTEIGNYVPFFALWLEKSKFWKNEEKKKNKPGDIIILQLCITNHNHIMYGSWDMENFMLFWTILCTFPLPPLTTLKIKRLKKWKKQMEISFYTCIPQMTIIWCMVPEI